ncbi:MAG: 5'-methylthioadenosine/adenosylhomocysteine nucleosidase [Oscillospiraceae bacterium]|nr:5'-methylthioadenosine/adenosylhomocysteine nucleosidase [Oscillospiraceae bacterium]
MKAEASIGVIGAMESEVAQLRGALAGTEVTKFSGLTFYSGTLGTHRVVLVRCGVGKVNAARCAQMLIDRYGVDCIVNTGIAGGVGAGLAVADVVIGTELVQHDFNAVAFGYARGNICDPTHRETPSVFRSDPELIAAFRAAAETLIAPARVKTGRIATGDLFVASAEAKRDIAETFGAVAAEMEGGAIAQVAAMAGVPFIVLRAISDLADGSSPASFDAFEQETADLSAAILRKLIEG